MGLPSAPTRSDSLPSAEVRKVARLTSRSNEDERAQIRERIAPVGQQIALPTNDHASSSVGLPAQQSRTKPLSPTMFHLPLTMSAETHAKLLRARDMMRVGSRTEIWSSSWTAHWTHSLCSSSGKFSRRRSDQGRPRRRPRASRAEVAARPSRATASNAPTGAKTAIVARRERSWSSITRPYGRAAATVNRRISASIARAQPASCAARPSAARISTGRSKSAAQGAAVVDALPPAVAQCSSRTSPSRSPP